MGKKTLNVAAISFTVDLGSLGLFFQPFLIVRVHCLFLNKITSGFSSLIFYSALFAPLPSNETILHQLLRSSHPKAFELQNSCIDHFEQLNADELIAQCWNDGFNLVLYSDDQRTVNAKFRIIRESPIFSDLTSENWIEKFSEIYEFCKYLGFSKQELELLNYFKFPSNSK